MTGPLRGWLLLAASVLTLVTWAFATPIGSSPDDDFHLVSTWCASPTGGAGLCEPGVDESSRVVPEALRGIACYDEPEDSAACQEELDWSLATAVDTDRGNFRGEYPPGYYAVHGLLAGPDLQLSALLMRLLNVVIFAGITAGLWLLLPRYRRPTLVWGWLAVIVPLGTFLLASNNPSSWAIIGVGSSWIALLGYFETSGPRRIGLGILFALAVLLAASARGDAAVYAGFAIAIVLLLVGQPTKQFLLPAILPIAMGLVALVFLLTSGMAGSAADGFSDSGINPDVPRLSGLALLAYNVLNLPLLWSGLLGQAGLGWMDVTMPGVVVFGAVAVFVALAFTGIVRMGPRKAIALLLAGAVLTALPLYILQAGGHTVGQQLQPRYLLPLILLFAGLLLLSDADKPVRLTRLQGWLVGLALAVVHFVALHITIRRYVTGAEEAGFNLDAGAEWWWEGVPGPNVVWIVGSLAFALVVALAVPLLTRPWEVPTASPVAPPFDSPRDSAQRSF